MYNRKSEELFDIIKTMSKSEKKSFHLFARRNIDKDNLKILRVYQVINNMEYYDEKALTRKLKDINSKQMPGLKANLYGLLLDNLRLIRKSDSIQLQLHQLMDHANILYDRGLYMPAIKALRRLRKMALEYNQISFAFQSTIMEKKVELVYGPGESENIKVLNEGMLKYSKQLSLLGAISNSSMLLYGWFKKHGIICSEESERAADEIFCRCKSINEKDLSFFPKLYLAQAKTYFHLLKGEWRLFYESCFEWVSLFESEPQMKDIEAEQYYRGWVFLSDAALLTRNRGILKQSIEELKRSDDKFYKLMTQLNWCLSQKIQDEGLIKQVITVIRSTTNSERIVLLGYKAGMLCRNLKDWSHVIELTHLTLNIKSDLRLDLQLKLRKIQIKAHNEIGNHEIISYLKLSMERFMDSVNNKESIMAAMECDQATNENF